MVKKLGESIGDHLLPEQEAILKNTFDGNVLPAEREDISAKDILSILIPRSGDEEDEQEAGADVFVTLFQLRKSLDCDSLRYSRLVRFYCLSRSHYSPFGSRTLGPRSPKGARRAVARFPHSNLTKRKEIEA